MTSPFPFHSPHRGASGLHPLKLSAAEVALTSLTLLTRVGEKNYLPILDINYGICILSCILILDIFFIIKEKDLKKLFLKVNLILKYVKNINTVIYRCK
jgi:hypothetical protein